MTSPASVQDDSALSPTTESTRFTDRLVQAGVGLTKLARSPSSSSLNSVLSLISDGGNNSDQFFRICDHCKNLLDARERLKARHFEKPIVHQFYEKMRTQIQEGNRFIDMYYKMWQSLNEGDSTYDLRDAQVVRGKIAKIGDNIDLISKRISTLVTVDENSPASLKQEFRLHQMVRSAAMIYLKNELLTTPPVPTTEEYEAIKKARQERIKARIAYERQLEEEQLEKLRESQREFTQRAYDLGESKSPTTTSSNQVNAGFYDFFIIWTNNNIDYLQLVLDQSQGWGTSGRAGRNMMISSTSVDPFVEQMSNLRFYIKQAREECKFEEVATLERNLKELQSAYFEMQQKEATANHD